VATELAAAGLADMHFAIRQAGEHGESASKASRWARIIGCGSAASGLVSIAVTKIAAGTLPAPAFY
jgi:hypothetical protein